MPKQEMQKVSTDSSLLKHSDKQRVRAQRPLNPVWYLHFSDGETKAPRGIGSAQGHTENRGKPRTGT